MIKTTVEYVPSKVGASYPYYGVDGDGLVVLFVKKGCGVVISNDENKMSDYQEFWNEDDFTPMNVVEVVLKVAE